MDAKRIEIDSIEKKLDSILRPIAPEESYIDGLKYHLSNFKPPVILEKKDYLTVVLFVISFLGLGLFLYWVLGLFSRKHNN